MPFSRSIGRWLLCPAAHDFVMTRECDDMMSLSQGSSFLAWFPRRRVGGVPGGRRRGPGGLEGTGRNVRSLLLRSYSVPRASQEAFKSLQHRDPVSDPVLDHNLAPKVNRWDLENHSNPVYCVQVLMIFAFSAKIDLGPRFDPLLGSILGPSWPL